MGFGTSKQTSTQTNDPWAKQAPYLTSGFARADDAFNQAQGAPKPDQFVAGFSPEQLGIFQKMMGYGNTDLNATSSAIGQTVGQAGANSVVDSFKKLAGWSPQGGVDSNISAAMRYADNPAVSGMVNSAMRGAERAATEQYLPAITRGAASSGNLNSSKTAISEGIVARGLAEKRADTEAGIRGDLFNQGLSLAEGARQYDNDSVMKSLLASLSGGNEAVGTGVNASSAGIDQARGIFDIATGGVAGQNAADQASLDNQMQGWQFGTDSPFAALNNYWNIVGGNSWGGSSTGTTTTKASPAQIIGGLLMGAGSLIPGKKY